MPWINHLPPVCWSTFGILVWNDSGYVNLTQWWYFFIIFEYILHISTPHIMIFCFPLPYFPLSQQVLYFLLSTLVLTLYIDVVLSLSIETWMNWLPSLNLLHSICLSYKSRFNVTYYTWHYICFRPHRYPNVIVYPWNCVASFCCKIIRKIFDVTFNECSLYSVLRCGSLTRSNYMVTG